MYVVLCIILAYRTKRAGHSSDTISKLQKQVFEYRVYLEMQPQIMIQSIVVSLFLAATSALYMIMQYVLVPELVVIVSQFMWQASHGMLKTS